MTITVRPIALAKRAGTPGQGNNRCTPCRAGVNGVRPQGPESEGLEGRAECVIDIVSMESSPKGRNQ